MNEGFGEFLRMLRKNAAKRGTAVALGGHQRADVIV